jgi:hypothetical protein
MNAAESVRSSVCILELDDSWVDFH